MNDKSGNGTNSFKVKIRTNTSKFTNMIIARFRESRYLVRESEVRSGNIQRESKRNQSHVHFTVELHMLTDFYTIRHRIYSMLGKYSTLKLLTCSPHL